MNRVDNLLNEIFHVESKWIYAWQTRSARRTHTGTLLLIQHDVETPLAEKGNANIKPQAYEPIGYSFNACVYVMEVLTGVLAYLAEGTCLVPTLLRVADQVQAPSISKKQTSSTSNGTSLSS